MLSGPSLFLIKGVSHRSGNHFIRARRFCHWRVGDEGGASSTMTPDPAFTKTTQNSKGDFGFAQYTNATGSSNTNFLA
jgi:hypothetical protein